MLPLLAVGVVFVIGGLLLRPRSRPGELRARGKVVQSWSGYAYGAPAWLYTVEFHDAAGISWRFQANPTGPRRPLVGNPVAVAYLASDPQATARRIDGVDGYVHWLVVCVGAAAVVIGSLLGLLT